MLFVCPLDGGDAFGVYYGSNLVQERFIIMTKSITIHDIERPVAERLEVYVRREDTSYNQAVKELLATALGVRSKLRKRIDNGLGKFRGSTYARSADALLAYVANADFSKVA